MSLRRVIVSAATPSKANNENAGFLRFRQKNSICRKMLFASSSKINENSGFLTPQKQNVLSKKKLFASASKTNNQNAGYLTPQIPNMFSGKKLLSDKRNVSREALRDLKTTSFNFTTLKIGNVFAGVKKTETKVQVVTPNTKNETSEPSKTSFTPQNAFNSTKTDMDYWNEKLMLNDDQFNLLSNTFTRASFRIGVTFVMLSLLHLRLVIVLITT